MNPEENHAYDPHATAFRAVADLERRGFTKGEIAEALKTALFEIEREQYRAN